MSYDSKRTCDNCGGPSPRVAVCGSCQQADRSFAAGHKAGMSDAANEIAQLRADLATAKALIRNLMNAAARAGYCATVTPTPENQPMIAMLDELGWQSHTAKVEAP